jgi:plastocyanin
MRKQRIVIGAALAGAMCLAIGGGSGAIAHAHPALAPHKTVLTDEVNGKYEFAKTTLKVAVGTKVTWNNKSDAPHTVTFKTGGKFDKSFAPSAKISYTFKKAGTYSYFCKYHPWMQAKVVVK